MPPTSPTSNPAPPSWMVHHLRGTSGVLTPPGLSTGRPFYDYECHPPNPLRTVASHAASFSRLPSPSSALFFPCTNTSTSSLASGLSPLVHPLQCPSAALVHSLPGLPTALRRKFYLLNLGSKAFGIWLQLCSPTPYPHTVVSSPLPSLLSPRQKEFRGESHNEG